MEGPTHHTREHGMVKGEESSEAVRADALVEAALDATLGNVGGLILLQGETRQNVAGPEPHARREA